MFHTKLLAYCTSYKGIHSSLCLEILHNSCVGDPRREELCLCSCQWHSIFPAAREMLSTVAAQEWPSSWLGEGRREKEKTLLYKSPSTQEEKFPSGHSKNSSNSVHLSFSLFWFNRHCWSSQLQARKVKMSERRWQKTKNWCILEDTQHPPKS